MAPVWYVCGACARDSLVGAAVRQVAPAGADAGGGPAALLPVLPPLVAGAGRRGVGAAAAARRRRAGGLSPPLHPDAGRAHPGHARVLRPGLVLLRDAAA